MNIPNHMRQLLIKSISLSLTLFTAANSISVAYAAEIIPIIQNANDMSIEEVELVVEDPIIEESSIQMVVCKTTYGYVKPSSESRAAYHITGGNVVKADIHSLGNEFITVEFNGRICYIKSSDLKAIVGSTDGVEKTIASIRSKCAFPAEMALEVIPAPHHYSVGGQVLYYNYQDYIWTLCVQYGIEDYFTYLLCQFFHESRYNQNAVSHTNDYGICQLNERYHDSFVQRVGHPEWDVKADPYANMYCGVHIMANNIKNRNGDIDIAMTDYNAGGGYYAKNGVRTVYTNRVHHWHSTLKALD